MTRWLLTLGAAVLAMLTTLTACAGSSDQATSATPTTTSAAVTQPHNKADVTFAQNMIPHHQQAVQMSDVILAKQGLDPRAVTLANQIKGAQGPEIQQMQAWLSAWGEPTTMAMPNHDMSGMMSDQDIAALESAQGAEASRLFLTQMIAHHQGAIAMAQDEIKAGQFPPAIAMAQAITAGQQQEITQMQGILESS